MTEGSPNSDFNKETHHENEIKNLLKQTIDEKIKENNQIINHLEIKLENKYGNEISLLNQKIAFKLAVGNCIEGNGFINIIDGENKAAGVIAENKFKKPVDDCINYSLFYFEIKCKIESVKSGENLMVIGFRNGYNAVKLDIDEAFIGYKSNDKNIKFKLPATFFWNDGDFFGLGLVYPPINKINELPYVFFTQNGKIIGK